MNAKRFVLGVQRGIHSYRVGEYIKMSTEVRNDECPMAALDIFRADESFLHLEENWHRGLGWWLVDGASRRRLSVLEAIHLSPSRVAHEVFLEAENLLWRLRSRRYRQRFRAGVS